VLGVYRRGPDLFPLLMPYGDVETYLSRARGKSAPGMMGAGAPELNLRVPSRRVPWSALQAKAVRSELPDSENWPILSVVTISARETGASRRR